VSKLKKAYSAFERLSATTSWPDHVTPLPFGEGEEKRFWPAGFNAGTTSAAIKARRPDIMVVSSDQPSSAAAVFTRNLCSAAPVSLSKEHLRTSASSMRAVVCNSGNANAATGERGMRDAETMAAETAAALGVHPEEVLVASTGVIGVALPIERMSEAIGSFSAVVLEGSGADAALAIMTTDTFPKFIAVDIALSGGTARLSGIAKGSGMICPDMATMLGFLFTDAAIDPALLQEMLSAANERSFNAITVDGDTSTNDMAAILASGRSGQIVRGSDDAGIFFSALETVMTFLARLIVLDGEGATKLVEIRVEGAENDEDAKKAARTIAGSSLVKTAMNGEDANWGRIIAAVGRSGARVDTERLTVKFNDLAILEPGYRSDFSEEEAKKILAEPGYTITISMGRGTGSASVWTCDLSREYVEINADYRT